MTSAPFSASERGAGLKNVPPGAVATLVPEPHYPSAPAPDSLRDHLNQLQTLNQELAHTIVETRTKLSPGDLLSGSALGHHYDSPADAHDHVREINRIATECLKLVAKGLQVRMHLEQQNADHVRQNTARDTELARAFADAARMAQQRDEARDQLNTAEDNSLRLAAERDRHISRERDARNELAIEQARSAALEKELQQLRLRDEERHAKEQVGLPKFMLDRAGVQFNDLLQRAKQAFPREGDRLEAALRSYATTLHHDADENEYISHTYELGERLIAVLRLFDAAELPTGNIYDEIVAWMTPVNEGGNGKCRAYIHAPGRGFDSVEMSSDRSIARVSGYHSWGVKNSKGIVVYPAKVE